MLKYVTEWREWGGTYGRREKAGRGGKRDCETTTRKTGLEGLYWPANATIRRSSVLYKHVTNKQKDIEQKMTVDRSQKSTRKLPNESIWTYGLRVRGMVKTATSQNGDKPKRLQVQRKRINLLSSTVDPCSVLLTKFELIQVCSFCHAVISL